MGRTEELRIDLLQAVADVVHKLDDRGIPLRVPELPLIGRVPIGNDQAAEAKEE